MGGGKKQPLEFRLTGAFSANNEKLYFSENILSEAKAITLINVSTVSGTQISSLSAFGCATVLNVPIPKEEWKNNYIFIFLNRTGGGQFGDFTFRIDY